MTVSPLQEEDKINIKQFCENKTNICLQFPDYILEHSAAIVMELSELCPNNIFFILGDTTFGSCCIDKVAGEHSDSDGIIHFGHSCLSTPFADSPPVLWIFERIPIDIDILFEAVNSLDSEKKILILTDTCTYYSLRNLKALLAESPSNRNVTLSYINEQYPYNASNNNLSLSDDVLYNIQGRWFSLNPELNVADVTLLYIGKNDTLTFSNIIMNTNFEKVFSFDPLSLQLNEHNNEASLMIRRRYIMVQKARDANTVGIIVGTLGVANYLNIIENLKRLILAKGKKPYLLAVGKPNPAKLGNFLEIDVFCLVACPENSLLDKRDFMKPIVTPYELLLALDLNSIWNPLSYELNLDVLLHKLVGQVANGNENSGNIQDESDEEPHFSLVSGAYTLNKRFIQKQKPHDRTESIDGDTALISKSSGTISKNLIKSAGAEFWRSRSFKGLDLEENMESTFSKLEIGRRGIAKNYSGENINI